MIEKIKRIMVQGQPLSRVGNSDIFHHETSTNNENDINIYDVLFTNTVTIAAVTHEGRTIAVGSDNVIALEVLRGSILITLGTSEKVFLVDFVNRPAPAPATPASKKVDYEALTNQILGQYPDKIRIERLLKKRPESMEDFVYKFFTEWNLDRNTIFVDRSVQTEAGKRRSLGDIFMIVRYYYSSAKLEDVVKILHEVLPKRLTGFRTSYCRNVKKRMFYYRPEVSNGIFDKAVEDEYGNLYGDY